MTETERGWQLFPPPIKTCVRCDVPMENEPVPCPEAHLGWTCLVLHYGPRCPACRGAVYERAEHGPA